jgi:hypothetical protein
VYISVSIHKRHDLTKAKPHGCMAVKHIKVCTNYLDRRREEISLSYGPPVLIIPSELA